jgi:hypothetical protein
MIFPRDISEPTENDIAIAEAEEGMADELMHGAMPVTSGNIGTD